MVRNWASNFRRKIAAAIVDVSPMFGGKILKAPEFRVDAVSASNGGVGLPVMVQHHQRDALLVTPLDGREGDPAMDPTGPAPLFSCLWSMYTYEQQWYLLKRFAVQDLSGDDSYLATSLHAPIMNTRLQPSW